MTADEPDRVNKRFEFTWTGVDCPWPLVKRTVKTVGWVLQQDRDYMVVATYDPESGRQAIAIPRGCITKTREAPQDADAPGDT